MLLSFWRILDFHFLVVHAFVGALEYIVDGIAGLVF